MSSRTSPANLSLNSEVADAVDAGRLKGSSFLSPTIVEWWVKDFVSPIERALIRYKIRPNTITTAGFLITCLGAVLIGTNHLIWAGWVTILAGCCDFWDGRIARTLNMRTEVGAFYDSCLDRYMDAATFFGLFYLFRDSYFSIVVAIAFLGTITTPYIRAKAESLGLSSNGGQMQRPERIAYIGIGSFLSGYLSCLAYPFLEPGRNFPPIFLMLALGVMAFMTNKVAIDRMRDAMAQLSVRDRQPRSN